MITDQTEVIRRALSHYHNKLNKLTEDYTFADPINEILGHDLSMNIQRVQGAESFIETPERSHEEKNHYENVICCALVNYISDLEALKKDVSGKLAGAKPTLEDLDMELFLTKQARGKMCK